MATLSLFTFNDWNNLQVAGAQASSTVPLNFSVGSDLLALVEGNTSSMLYLQANIVQLLALSRASTSVGADLDSFFADFNFLRLSATYATGTITLLRNQALGVVTIPADGSAVLLANNSAVTYVVVPDTTQPGYSSTTGNYTAAPGQTTLAVTVTATTAGAVGKQIINAQMLLSTNASGFDTATTTAGFLNGQELETDAAFRARFIFFLESLSRATITSISSAILGVQQGLTFTIDNNVSPNGTFEPGNFIVTVDDGSGNPPDTLITAVDVAVTAYQGNTISHNIRKPVIVPVSVTMNVTLTVGVVLADTAAALTSALTAFVNALQLGDDLQITRLSAVAYDASAAVANVSNVTINGNVNDLITTKNQRIQLVAQGMTVTPAFAA